MGKHTSFVILLTYYLFECVLKIDSTKKILRKLSGDSKASATWVTNVGNEYNTPILQSNKSLKPLADVLVKRYADAKVNHPQILYTDRDFAA